MNDKHSLRCACTGFRNTGDAYVIHPQRPQDCLGFLQAGTSTVVDITVTVLMLTCFILSTRFFFWTDNLRTSVQTQLEHIEKPAFQKTASTHRLCLLPALDPRKDCLAHPACGGDLSEHRSPLLGEIKNHLLSEMLWWTKRDVDWSSWPASVPAGTLPLTGHGGSIITLCGTNRRPSLCSIVCIH